MELLRNAHISSLIKSVGFYETKGPVRQSMEDITVVERDDTIFPDNRPCMFLAVFDGHSGKSTADFVAKELLNEIKLSLSNTLDERIAIENAFINTDLRWRKIQSTSVYNKDSGSTAIVCLITPNLYICANIGDCRCVLRRTGGIPISLSFDHKPHSLLEYTRITASGGYVSYTQGVSRVCGSLAVSRAFGDFEFKIRGTPKTHAVTACPEIIIEPRTSEDDFIIIACDGLWDVMSNEYATSFVYNHMKIGFDSKQIAAMIVNEAINKGSKDNVSCIVVYL